MLGIMLGLGGAWSDSESASWPSGSDSFSVTRRSSTMSANSPTDSMWVDTRRGGSGREQRPVPATRWRGFTRS